MIQSRHIVAVTDAGVDDGTPYLAMEFVLGKELAEVTEGDIRRNDAAPRVPQGKR